MVITKLKFSLLITCFTYLNDGKKSQMLFSTNFYTGEIAESLCSKADDGVRKNITNEECNLYKFDIDNSYCDANDVNINFNMYKDDRFKSWQTFFKSLMKIRLTSEDLTRKCDTIFQQIFYLIQNERKKLLSMSV